MSTEPMPDLPPELKVHLTRYQAPPGLKRRIGYLLEQQATAPAPASTARSAWWRWFPLAASFACGALLAVSLMASLDAARDADQVEQQVVAGHLRSLMAGHLTDVASSDRHTVKPWFTGKLDYAPPVIDLADEGFPLIGGRLDYLQQRPVAALVYRKGGHTINVFVLPAPAAAPAATLHAVRQGWQLASWSQGGMRFWAVSDVGRDELAAFVAAMQSARS
ncbi:anti-sigma factor family protein [Caenimonas terrae]|uniref:Anti-sigma factor family protein n=1 Tax=Caenimonas terrae TaxID=696074 RepID=A0ABW0NA65_9BURK